MVSKYYRHKMNLQKYASNSWTFELHLHFIPALTSKMQSRSSASSLGSNDLSKRNCSRFSSSNACPSSSEAISCMSLSSWLSAITCLSPSISCKTGPSNQTAFKFTQQHITIGWMSMAIWHFNFTKGLSKRAQPRPCSKALLINTIYPNIYQENFTTYN